MYIHKDHAFHIRTDMQKDVAEFLHVYDFLPKFENVLKGLRSDCETFILLTIHLKLGH